ncbi:MAG: hypothetical protein JEZ07_14770 [Phycisphaerae bacterium]|nr:hypothetical protein [Phycisphaerae bacterium]
MQTKTNIKEIMAIDICLKSFIALFLIAFAGKISNEMTMPVLFGVKVHVFQYFILLAAFMYGPIAGLTVGAGSCWITAIALGNPYIIIGNALLGFVAGFMFRKTNRIAVSVAIAFICQMLWILISDMLFMRMPFVRVCMIIISLFVFDILWTLCAGLTYNFFKKKNLIPTGK